MSDSIRTRLHELGTAMRGELLLPHEDWGDVASPWNRAIVQQPAAVAVPADVADVQLIVAAARDAGLGISVQPGGHGPHGGELRDCILVRTAAFDELVIDTESQSARVGAGVSWGRVLSALDGTGLVARRAFLPGAGVRPRRPLGARRRDGDGKRRGGAGLGR